ncbi:MAG: alanine racemase [Anaerolineales bacterium]|nr:alanine racemase [Chloroflexota bacterium]MBL6979669.1 alanine racemase [Anaerolineales bacterium]
MQSDSQINRPTITTNEVVRPTLVEVDLSRLADNYRAIQEKVAPALMMPVLKANAYGHGLVDVGHLMESLGADYIGVAVLEEGILLREQGIQTPILVLGGIFGNQVPFFLKYDLTITASSIEKLWQIEEISEQLDLKAKVHLKIDTGMERIGVHYYNAEELLEASVTCKHLDVEGIFSHFANSDAADLRHARLQIERFEEVLSFYEKHDLQPPRMRHMANSGAILQLPEANYDIVRPGLVLYGVYPSPESSRTIDVSPALSWKSRVVYFKVIKPGHPVGYGSTWETDHFVRAVTIPVGYGDGYFRAMSHKAQVVIRGKRYPVVGRISMDQIVVNIEWDSAYNDDEVLLIGEMDDESVTAEDLAEWAGTIPYEILTNINTRVPRVYVRS